MNVPVFPWLPLGYAVADNIKIGRVLTSGQVQGSVAYQICGTKGDEVCLLLKTGECSDVSLIAFKGLDSSHFLEIDFGGDNFLSFVCHKEFVPMKIGDIPTRTDFLSFSQLDELFSALVAIQDKNWHSALYFPVDRQAIAFEEKEDAQEKRKLAVRLLTGGVADTRLSPTQIHYINRWVSPSQIRRLYKTIGMDVEAKRERKTYSVRPSSTFTLPGQPALEKFLREQVIDYYQKQSEYEKMNIHPVRGILLHGRPGSGKTYSVQKLSEFLGWQLFDISAGNVGSKYIHETSKKIKMRFDEARKNSPAIVFLDELDALGSSREMSGHSHKMEETNELLKQIEKAGHDGLLVIAATNYIDAIDPALMRKGRFDAVIEVQFPEAGAMADALKHCLSEYPHEAGLVLEDIAQNLVGRSMADIAWIINKSGYIAVKSGKEKIDRECLEMAMNEMPTKSGIRFVL